MPAAHLVLGLDGADLGIVRELGASALPALHAIASRGALSAQASIVPAATLPNWTTFLTGVDPGRHGVFDFTLREGESVRFVGGTVREVPTVFSRLDALGRRCAVLFFPATYPPERLEHGVFVSGWDSPVAFRADKSFVWPESLHRTIERRFGPIRFDDVDEFDAERGGFHERLAPALARRIERKVELARFLLDSNDWDVFAIYFGELDTASHHLFAHHDPASPRYPGATDASDGLASTYRSIDGAVASIVEAAGGESVELTIVSDHGSGGSSDRVVHLNRALADAGLLTFRERATTSSAFSAAKDLALTKLPPAIRERIFRFAGNLLPSWLESRQRFAAIDFARTRAFSEELNYFPSVCLNLRGREPNGIVEPSEHDRVVREAVRALRSLRDPESGRPVVKRVDRREDLYDGPYVERAPDLIVEFELVRGYSYNLMPSRGPGPVFRTLDRSEFIGRKGRSLPGSHRPNGIFLAAGPTIAPGIELEMGIADATATLLARMGVAVPPEFAGRVLFEILRENLTAGDLALPDAARPVAPTSHDEAAIERRLRALGYVE